MFLVGDDNWGCQIEHFCIGSKVNFLVVKQLFSKRFIAGAYVTELLERKASFLAAVVCDVDFHWGEEVNIRKVPWRGYNVSKHKKRTDNVFYVCFTFNEQCL